MAEAPAAVSPEGAHPQATADAPAGVHVDDEPPPEILEAIPAPETVLPSELRAKLEQARAELSGERRQVAVLFADMSGFTAMSERMDPEDISVLMNAVLQRLAAAVYRYEGYVDKFIGDAVMALFGAPLAHEDDPERAVLAGFDMLRVITAHNAAGGPPLALRVGINLGDVVAAHLGTTLRLQYTVMGDAVNLAQRLESNAQPNTILVSESLHRRIVRRFAAERLPPLTVKGRSEPVQTYRVLDRPPSGVVHRTVSAFHGREPELARLASFLERAARGEARALVIEGEPGTGKSRLVQEALGRTAQESLLLELAFTAVRLPGQRTTTASLFQQLLPEQPAGAAAVQRAAALLSGEAAEHQAGIEGLAAEADPSLGRETPDDSAAHDAALARQRRWGALAALTRRVSENRPVLVLAEDLHWSDEASRELLQLLSGSLAGRPFAVLATGRAPIPDMPMLEVAERMDLAPLGRAAAEALLGQLVEDLEPATRRELLKRAEGNPLFVEELARAFAEAAERGLDVASLPDTLQGLLVSRIDRLEGPVRRLLQMASVLGVRFPTRLLRLVYELEPQKLGFQPALRALEESGFLEVEMNGEELRRFHHALVQEAAYGGLLVRVRRVLHESVARLGEAYYGERREAEAPFFAHHYWEAGLPSEAAPHLWTAGLFAAEGYDLPAAERFLERLGQTLDERPELLPDPEERARFAETLGGVLLHRGRLEPSERRFQQLEQLGRDHDRAEWRARGIEHLGRIAWYRGQLDGARASFEEGLRLIGGAESRLAADLHNDLGIVFYYRGDPARALEEHERARRLRERIEDRLGLAKSLSNMGNVLLHLHGDPDAAEENYRAALELARSTGDRQMTSTILNNLGGVAQERGLWADAIGLFAQAARIEEEMGWRFLGFLTLRNRASCELALGRVADALRHLRQLMDRGDAVLEPMNRVNVRMFLFDAYLRALADSRAGEALAQARACADDLGVPEVNDDLWLREGRLLAAGGRWDAAGQAFARAVAEARRVNHPETGALARAHLARALARGGGAAPPPADGEPPRTAPLTALVGYLTADADATRAASSAVARRLEEAARLAAELGEVALARAAFQRAAEVWGDLEEREEQARAVNRAREAMTRLEERLPEELRGSFAAHERNASLRA